MGQKTPEGDLCQALLDFVIDGKYPESEDVVASDFPSSAVANELEQISKAREQAETEICSLSQENSADVDGWIAQARQLHADIERSRVTAREIVARHENTKPIQLQVEDATAKVELLKTEIAFNQALTETLEQVHNLSRRVDAGRNSLAEGDIIAAIESLEDTEKILADTAFPKNSNVTAILYEGLNGLRRSIIEALSVCWGSLVQIDNKKHQLVLPDQRDTSLELTIIALSRVNMLDAINGSFQKHLLASIFNLIILPNLPGKSYTVSVQESGVYLDSLSTASVAEVLERVSKVLGYLRQHLPTSISARFSEIVIPTISSQLISSWLSPSIPTHLDGLHDYEDTLDRVLQFSQTIENLGWDSQTELVSWVNQAPRLWLARRRVSSLDEVRKALADSKGTTKKVERVEKEKVSSENEALLEGGATDDWDAGWENDNEEATNNANAKHGAEDEEDVSAWGLDEDDGDTKLDDKPAAEEPLEDDDAEDAWGWGDDEDQAFDKDESAPAPVSAAGSKQVNGKNDKHAPAQREITLREYYTVTDIPDSILATVRRQITDSQDLSREEFTKSRVASSAAGLLALPTLILAMFRATAPTFYTLKLNAGQMYLYNDSMFLAEQIRNIVEEHKLNRLSSDIDGLEKFGKLSYSKEMQTQRTILIDLLDGAQGFGNCSQQPFLGECENAVSATVDRIRDVYKEWKSILSHSALLQSVGSLLSTVINKIIVDVEDLGDISEPESQRLVSFCNQVTTLEDLFIPESSGDTEAVPMTAVYVRNWLKFQYLINILESSLADIKFLWLEGELRLEFSPEEVIDLIEALFAESEHRRRAIAEIRRS
ncbi:ribosome biogenesis protein ytm1 [Paecilomyces lecythidis]|uniref:Ribosome biogenesis protein ytm1 n=1 Tax=Paecilomyces lecythidis TaxID=3004212 RepID=A0ABR3X7E0_9EURO